MVGHCSVIEIGVLLLLLFSFYSLFIVWSN